MPVSKENFGSLEIGQKVQKFTLSNENGVLVEVTKYLTYIFKLLKMQVAS